MPVTTGLMATARSSAVVQLFGGLCRSGQLTRGFRPDSRVMVYQGQPGNLPELSIPQRRGQQEQQIVEKSATGGSVAGVPRPPLWRAPEIFSRIFRNLFLLNA